MNNKFTVLNDTDGYVSVEMKKKKGKVIKKQEIILGTEDEEINTAIKIVCDTFNTTEIEATTDWYLMSEVDNVILDRRELAKGKPAIYSDALKQNKIEYVKSKNKVEAPITDLPLNPAIALLLEFKRGPDTWVKYTVCIMRTITEFWATINAIRDVSTTDSIFCSALAGKEDEAEEIFNKVMNFGKNVIDPTRDENSIKADAPLVKQVSAFAARYNDLHPIWTFVMVPHNIDRNAEIFYRNDIQDVNINTKDTRTNRENGICLFDPLFGPSFLSYLILSFIGNNLPSVVTAISFSKTISVGRTMIYRGYRIRLWINDKTSNSKYTRCFCSKFIENEFIREINNRDKDGIDYGKCIVNIMPKDQTQKIDY